MTCEIIFTSLKGMTSLKSMICNKEYQAQYDFFGQVSGLAELFCNCSKKKNNSSMQNHQAACSLKSSICKNEKKC